MNILIVDDNNDKIAKIVSVINTVSENFNIDTVIDSISAQIQLKQTKYDLLILDLLLPIRPSQEPVPNGGELLLKEITRNKTLKTPRI
jgi:DNA-binding response OmpR family regulator